MSRGAALAVQGSAKVRFYAARPLLGRHRDVRHRPAVEVISGEAQRYHRARAFGGSWAYISDIQRNEVNPGIDVLQRISRGLGVPLSRLIAEAEEGAVTLDRRSL